MTMPETDLQTAERRDFDALWSDGSRADLMKESMRNALFNGALSPDGRELIACDDEAAVVRAVRYAASEGLPLATVSGGHDPWGRACTDGNLVIDLRRMKGIRVDDN